MYTPHMVEAPLKPAYFDEPLTLPLTILLAMPRYPGGIQPVEPFNVVGAVATLLGGAGWDQARRAMDPHLWAPGRDDIQLDAFVNAPLPGAPWPSPWVSSHQLRISTFPGVPGASPPGQFDIVHFAGNLVQVRGYPALDLGTRTSRRLRAEPLRDALVAIQTRLLILQIPEAAHTLAERLADIVTGGGGPAVLVVWEPEAQLSFPFRSPSQSDLYFLSFYANIVHNQPLPEVAQPGANTDASLFVELTYASGQEEALLFSRAADTLLDRLRRAQEQGGRQLDGLSELRQRANRFLSPTQVNFLERRAGLIQTNLTELRGSIGQHALRMESATSSLWTHEHEGVMLLPSTAEAVPEIESALVGLGDRYTDLFTELEQQESAAPRVLNAHFVEQQSNRVLDPREGLVAESEYALLLDVGPWRRNSLVRGHSKFPEEALPSGEEGYVVDVVVVSDDFTPNLVSARMWVPRQTGRSHPIVDGVRSPTSGPVALHLRAPSFPDSSDDTWLMARARLCVYYANNLLQAAVVKATVIRTAGVAVGGENVVDVDFALTGGFQEVDAHFSERALQFGVENDSSAHPVSASLTVNGDGANGHRLIISFRETPPQGDGSPPVASGGVPPLVSWVPYNPQAAVDVLEEARRTLLSAFTGLNPGDNCKTRDEFQRDLRELARVGWRLFSEITSRVVPDDATLEPREWTRRLKAALAGGAVIQVARTASTPTEYVFPWALVYDYPMSGPEFKFCPSITEEWSESGRRTTPRDQARNWIACRYAYESWHRENIYCPFGFWGLQHIIEQPQSVLYSTREGWELRSVPRQIRPGEEAVNLGIAITEDSSLNAAEIAAHVQALAGVKGIVRKPQVAADDVDTVRLMLSSPAIAYFLCHGERDRGPYIGVGPRDNSPQHKIYPDMVQAWADTQNTPNLAAWPETHPLVIINGCQTAALAPQDVLTFVSSFTYAGASGIIGTEVSVLLPLAIEVATSLLTRLALGASVGDTLQQIRWELVNKGNLLGLAYTYYGMSDLHVDWAGRRAPKTVSASAHQLVPARQ